MSTSFGAYTLLAHHPQHAESKRSFPFIAVKAESLRGAEHANFKILCASMVKSFLLSMRREISSCYFLTVILSCIEAFTGECCSI